jgi:hypothetical protein
MADLGPGDDRLRVEGNLRAVDFIRLAGGAGQRRHPRRTRGRLYCKETEHGHPVAGLHKK